MRCWPETESVCVVWVCRSPSQTCLYLPDSTYLSSISAGRGEDDVDDDDDEEDALVRGSVLCEAYLLGRAYAALGQNERAVTWLTRAARWVRGSNFNIATASTSLLFST